MIELPESSGEVTETRRSSDEEQNAQRQTFNAQRLTLNANDSVEVGRPVRRSSRPCAQMHDPEVVEGLDPKPLAVRGTERRRVEVNSRHLNPGGTRLER